VCDTLLFNHFLPFITGPFGQSVIRPQCHARPLITNLVAALCITGHTDHRLTHIYNLDAVPPIHVVSNHVNTISLPLQVADRLRRVQPVAVANHVKARQSPIERAVT